MSATESHFTFPSAGDVSVHVYEWSPPNPRAAVQIAHGAAEHAARYSRLAGRLVSAGYAVFANDHRGHGKTAEEGKLGYFAEQDGWNLAVGDMVTLNHLIRDRLPGKPVALLGHSMGSLMAQQFLIDHGDTVDAVVLSGSTVADAFAAVVPALQQEAEKLGREAPSEIMAQLMQADFNAEFPAANSAYDWLSTDAKEVQKYIDDPLCGFGLHIGSWLDMLHSNAVTADVERLKQIPRKLPLYIFAGDQDPVSSKLAALHILLDRYQQAGLVSVSHRFYAGCRHEMLNERNRETVTDELLNWLNHNLQATDGPDNTA